MFFPEEGQIRYNSAPLGQVAQLVEQRTENPRVDGSIPPLATSFIKGLAARLGPFRLRSRRKGDRLIVLFLQVGKLPAAGVGWQSTTDLFDHDQ